MYSERLLDHFRRPRYAGELAPPAVTVLVSNPACGDVLQLWVRWEAGRVAAARFKAQGCPPAIACGSALAEWLHGRERAALAGLTAAEIEACVGGLPPASSHAAGLALEAVRELLAAASRPRDGQ